MNLPYRVAAVVLLGALVSQTALHAVDGKKAEYIGGTVTGMPEKTEGKLDTSNEVTLTFTPDKKERLALAIPYDKITSIEYGQ